MCPLNSEIETLPSVSKLSCKEQSMKLQQEGREGTSCGLSQHGAAHSIPCCQGAVWVGSLLRRRYTSLEVQLVINSVMMCFMHKASLSWRGSRLSGEKHGGISGCGGLPLCSWWASVRPAGLLPRLLLAWPHTSPVPQGNCTILLTCPQTASSVFPLLRRKLRGCTKFPYCNMNLGVPLAGLPNGVWGREATF